MISNWITRLHLKICRCRIIIKCQMSLHINSWSNRITSPSLLWTSSLCPLRQSLPKPFTTIRLRYSIKDTTLYFRAPCRQISGLVRDDQFISERDAQFIMITTKTVKLRITSQFLGKSIGDGWIPVAKTSNTWCISLLWRNRFVAVETTNPQSGKWNEKARMR